MPSGISEIIYALASEATDWPSTSQNAPFERPVDWRAFWADCANAGLLGLNMPTAYGGAGGTAVQTLEAMTLLGKVCLDNALPMGINSQIWTVQEPLMAFATQDQKDRYLPKLIKGDMIGAFAMTEAGAGSDALSLTTRAERVGDGYVLNGSKCYVGLALDCDMALVFASTAPERKSWGISAFIVEKGDAGFIQGPAQPKMGLKTLAMGEMSFENCAIPENRRVGPEGGGASMFRATMDWERSFLFATQVGVMERQLDDMTGFAKARNVFDQPISQFQSVSNRIADMAVRLETSRLLQEKAALLKDAGTLTAKHAAMTKLHISEAFMASSLDAFRISGGRGYLEGSMVAETLKDALGGVIYSGTSDVQRNLIARLQEVQGR